MAGELMCSSYSARSNSCPLHDPFIVRIDHAGKLIVRQNMLRHIGANG
jgi:hypothetical protein